MAFKAVGVVLLPRRSGTPISNQCAHQQLRNQDSYRPRIPRSRYLFGFSYTRPRCVLPGANSFCRYFHVPYKPHHQSQLEKSILSCQRWNTIACSSHGSCRCEEHHSRRRADQFRLMFCWRRIPKEIWNHKTELFPSGNDRNWLSKYRVSDLTQNMIEVNGNISKKEELPNQMYALIEIHILIS